ncbi:MAG: dihydroorotate dehydrogenase electron transfer subunit, partial [Clostridia bacterium]|nr:dihydroorotate dehydrogenase electron transfer subunit [Clostridia bacterium]
MNDFPCTILRRGVLHGAYHRIVFHAPHVAAEAKPGQFVHVRIGEAMDHILRRPFSICDADAASGELTLVFKVVGA